jgi:hypothetical protein
MIRGEIIKKNDKRAKWIEKNRKKKSHKKDLKN